MQRRALLAGLGALIAAPAIVRVSSLMPISVQPVWNPTAIEIEARIIEFSRERLIIFDEFFNKLGEILAKSPDRNWVDLTPGAINYA